MKAAPYIAFAMAFSGCLGAGVYLVMTEHYGWAWIPFLIATNLGVKGSE